MIKLLSIAATALLTFNAMAIDTAKCPDKINVRVRVDKVNKTSKYSKIPGWKEAQTTLKNLRTIETELKLESKSRNCVYKDQAENIVTLSTASFRDPEMQEPQLVDQLVLNLKVDQSTYVSFVPVKKYSLSGVSLFSADYSVKVKTRLFIAQTKRMANIDLGMITVSAQ